MSRKSLIVLALLLGGSCSPGSEPLSHIHGLQPDPQLVFENLWGERYRIDYNNMRAGLEQSHTGVLMHHCSTASFHCLQADVTFVAPKLCDFNTADVVWNLDSNVQFRKVFSEGPQTYFERLRVDGYFEGLVYEYKRGIVGFWLAESHFERNQRPNVFLRQDAEAFFGCS